MNLWYGRISSWDIRCPGGFCLESGPLSLTCSSYTLLSTLLMIDTKQMYFRRYTFPCSCVWEGCIIILLSTRLGYCVSFDTHPTPASHFTRKTKRKGRLSGARFPFISWVRMRRLDWFPVPPLSAFRWIPSWLGFTSSDSAQSMLCTVGRIHNGPKVMFFFMPATGPHYHHYAEITHLHWTHTVKEILEAWVNACWVYSIESVSKMYLVLSSTYLFFFTVCGVVCVQLSPSSGRKDISINHLIIIIKSEVLTFPIVVISFRVCVPEVVVPSLAVGFIYIPRKLGLVSFITVQSYDVRT